MIGTVHFIFPLREAAFAASRQEILWNAPHEHAGEIRPRAAIKHHE